MNLNNKDSEQEGDPFSIAAKQSKQDEVDRFVASGNNHPAELDAILADRSVMTRVKNSILRLLGYHVGNDEDGDDRSSED